MRPLVRRSVAVVVLVVLLASAGCGSDGGDDPEQTGKDARAHQVLEDAGLSGDQADCMIDQLGVDTVVEAPDLNALADGGPYQDAVEVCLP